MEKQIKAKVKEAEEFLSSGDIASRDEFLKYLFRWIGWLQHERFIHLMVTLFFALFTFIMIFGLITTQNLTWLFLILIFGITTGFYIKHYFLLENKTQYLYELYDKIEKM